MRKLSLSGATRDCYHRTHARRMKKKKKRLKISNAVVLETRLRQYVLVSLLSSNFIGCTLFLCFIFFLFAPTFFFFLLRCQPVIAFGFTSRFPSSMSCIIAPLFAITFLHSKSASMAWGESARACDSIYLILVYGRLTCECATYTLPSHHHNVLHY